MPPALNNVTLSDAYTDATTLILSPPRESVTVLIFNNGVYYSKSEAPAGFASYTQALDWQAEKFLPAGRYIFDRDDLLAGNAAFNGFKFRNGVTGLVAQITAA